MHFKQAPPAKFSIRYADEKEMITRVLFIKENLCLRYDKLIYFIKLNIMQITLSKCVDLKKMHTLIKKNTLLLISIE